MAEPSASTSSLAGPHVLVPIELAALVATTGAPADGWTDVTPSYEPLRLQLTLGANFQRAPFTPLEKPPAGVHLHWAMPDGLTHGREKEGRTTYHTLPNRWLVVRTAWSSAAGSAGARAWVVRSDAISDEDSGSSVSWARQEDGTWVQAFLGVTVDAADWGGEAEDAPPPFLTAIGAGQPAFAASYWNCHGVYGLHDDLADLRGPFPLTISYVVVGWYSDPAADPLAGVTSSDFAKRLEELGWSPAGTVGAPTDTLVHGLLSGVEWPGADGPYVSGVPSGSTQVSVGNTAIEALSALVGHLLPEDADAERLLDAFQFDLLEQLEAPDGLMVLEEELHRREFGPREGGLVWDVRPDPDESDPRRILGTRSTPPLDPATGAALVALNREQRKTDRLAATLLSLQERLYATWFKKVLLDNDPAPDPALPTPRQVTEFIRQKLLPQVEQARSALADARAELEQALTDFRQLISKNVPGFDVVARAMPRYWTPADPVVVLSGAGVQRSFRHGEDGRYSDDGRLAVRTTGETVTGLSVTPDGAATEVTVDWAALQPLFHGFSAGAIFPVEVPALYAEAVLLDTTLAEPIARTAYGLAGVTPTDAQLQSTIAAIQGIQTGFLNAAIHRGLDASELAAVGGLVGPPPSKVAIALWEQPWIPLFLQWEVDWYPSAIEPSKALDGWSLDDVDFAWEGGDPTEHGNHRTLGSVALNPGTATNLSAPIERYVRLHPKDENREVLLQIAQAVADLNIVSQTLSGFGWTLVGDQQTLQFPIVDPVDPELGRQVAAKLPAGAEVSPQTTFGFFPLRAGHVVLSRIEIVDAFGQVQQIVEAGSTPQIVIAEPLRTPGQDEIVQLPPRLSQPSRLLFRWVSAASQDAEPVESTSDPATTPIAGWLLPNHLDASLALYDAAGGLLGELQLIDGSVGPSGTGIRWVEAPGKPGALGAAPSFPPEQRQLEAFANALLALGLRGENALGQLMHVIDDVLWTVNPLGAWQDQALALLVGRPLALARATLRLDLLGLPAYDQRLDRLKALIRTDVFPTDGFTETQLAAVLGDVRQLRDGLIGYFLADDYERFYLAQHAVSPPPDSTYVLPNAPVELVADPDADAIDVTLVLDPRGVVHATTGILPTKSIGLPPPLVAAALAAMDVTFMAGPLLTDPVEFAAPLPAVQGGSWSWLSHPTTATWQEVKSIGRPSPVATLDPTAPVLREGWLKLSGAVRRNGGRGRGG